MNYRKYADLTNYLFTEVRESFDERGFLTSEEFFCIVIWKANRSKGRIKEKLLRKGELGKVVKELTSDIYQESDKKEKLRILIEQWELRLPMASAILAVLYPEDFIIYDYRGREVLSLKDFSERKNQVDLYFSEYLAKAKAMAEGTTMRNKDNYLWGKSFYKSLINFLKEGK